MKLTQKLIILLCCLSTASSISANSLKIINETNYTVWVKDVEYSGLGFNAYKFDVIPEFNPLPPNRTRTASWVGKAVGYRQQTGITYRIAPPQSNIDLKPNMDQVKEVRGELELGGTIRVTFPHQLGNAYEPTPDTIIIESSGEERSVFTPANFNYTVTIRLEFGSRRIN